MILDAKIAKELETLLHPDVEEAILKLLEFTLNQEETILRNPEAKYEDLKLYQGKHILIHELKQYKHRISDAIKG